MEYPDATPPDITTDYSGNPIVRVRIMPGPFQNFQKNIY